MGPLFPGVSCYPQAVPNPTTPSLSECWSSHQLVPSNPLRSSAENLPTIPDVSGVHRDPGVSGATSAVAMGDEAEGMKESRASDSVPISALLPF